MIYLEYYVRLAARGEGEARKFVVERFPDATRQDDWEIEPVDLKPGIIYENCTTN